MLSDQLQEETKLQHQTLENRLIAKIKSINDPADYVILLRLFYGYYHALEQRIEPAIDQALLPDYTHRRKSHLILSDLKALQLKTPKSVPVSVNLPPIVYHLQAMGALYALETFTMSGKVISKIISKKLNLTESKGLLFFEGYGKDTWRWLEVLKKAINLLPRNSIESDMVIASANETFSKFNEWIDKFDSEIN